MPSAPTSCHATLVAIAQQGVLLRGESGIGKSTLALGLIDRGHRLVSDDLVEFSLCNQQLIGTVPRQQHALIQIDGIGLFDIARLYGPKAAISSHPIHLVVDLTTEPLAEEPLLTLSATPISILNQTLPAITLNHQHHRITPQLLEMCVKRWHNEKETSVPSYPTHPDPLIRSSVNPSPSCS
ncbi:MAG: HPr kinase/phosphatase C-terminal domain-containing protein [Gammaproteobacteria bacterium]|nr:HPr kinase/phosphatase C-terminal domain-containing protein [Gammaproteobacteria bacterium]